MGEKISRIQSPASAVIADGETVGNAADISPWGGVGFLIPSTWDGGDSVTFQCAESVGGTFGAPHDKYDAALSQDVTAGKWYDLPEQLAKMGAVKFVAASAVGADTTIILSGKG